MTARSASRAPGSLNAHTAMKLITGPVELPLSMVAEYRLDMLGPWESADGAGTEALTTSWVSPDPLHDGGNIFYSEITALYTNGLGNLIYFEGTDPRDAVTLASLTRRLWAGRRGSSSRRDLPSKSGTRTWTSEANTICDTITPNSPFGFILRT